MRATYSDFPENSKFYIFVYIKNLLVQIKLSVQLFYYLLQYSQRSFSIFTYVNLWRYACQQEHPRALFRSLVQRISLHLRDAY